jgi:hypothetical protein
LLDKHDIVIENQRVPQSLILNYIKRHSSENNEATLNITQHEFNRDILIWFVRDLLAFENVQKPGLVDFFAKVLPNKEIHLPCSKTLAGTALNDVYLAVLSKVKEELANIRSICVMADSWTDRYHGRSYVGIRVSFIRDWTYCLLTLSCHALPGSHTGQALADHIKQTLSAFFGSDLKKLLIATCHDGAANMMKASQLLKVQSVQHCVAHALNLLITVDSLHRVDELVTLVQKCRDIVTSLHFKSYMLEEQQASESDVAKLDELREKIKVSHDIIDLDDQFPVIVDDDMNDETSSAVQNRSHHMALKGSCPTRWNSTLTMIESVIDLQQSVDNSLKKIGKAELCFSSNEYELLQALAVLLKDFEKFTELISTNVPVLSMVPLIKIKIKEICQPGHDDDESIRDLKRLILGNVERRLAENDFMRINQVLDPMTKDIFSLDEAAVLLKKAFTIASQKGIISVEADANNATENSQCSAVSLQYTLVCLRNV